MRSSNVRISAISSGVNETSAASSTAMISASVSGVRTDAAGRAGAAERLPHRLEGDAEAAGEPALPRVPVAPDERVVEVEQHRIVGHARKPSEARGYSVQSPAR